MGWGGDPAQIGIRGFPRDEVKSGNKDKTYIVGISIARPSGGLRESTSFYPGGIQASFLVLYYALFYKVRHPNYYPEMKM